MAPERKKGKWINQEQKYVGRTHANETDRWFFGEDATEGEREKNGVRREKGLEKCRSMCVLEQCRSIRETMAYWKKCRSVRVLEHHDDGKTRTRGKTT